MKTVADTKTFVVVGARPRSSAIDALHDVPAGGEAMVFVLGLRPTQGQQRVTQDALQLAAERRFTLTAELVSDRSQLNEHLRGARIVRVLAGRGERRRWDLAVGSRVNPDDAR
jgi:phage-related tail fiber protein